MKFRTINTSVTVSKHLAKPFTYTVLGGLPHLPNEQVPYAGLSSSAACIRLSSHVLPRGESQQ